MDSIQKVRSISIWIFIIPLIAVNACLIIITSFHGLFPNREDVLVGFIFPYIGSSDTFFKEIFYLKCENY